MPTKLTDLRPAPFAAILGGVSEASPPQKNPKTDPIHPYCHHGPVIVTLKSVGIAIHTDWQRE